VANVVDGDTIDVENCSDAGRVRLILVETPEVFGEIPVTKPLT
jgi:endonuclease YncB( thermonuclease family)